MNIKQFIVICACEKLPSDIICKIWKHVKDSSADSIRNLYYFKVQRNMDFFLILSNLTDEFYSSIYINRIIQFIINKITYKYIQGNSSWINLLFYIIDDYQLSHVPIRLFELVRPRNRTFIDKNLNVNNIMLIMNNIYRGSSSP
jgi:hypothetical protein